MDTIQLLLRLIRAEICGDSPTDIDLDSSALTQLWKISKKHDIGHIIASALLKNELIEANDIKQELKKSCMLSIYRCESMKHAYSEICSALENAEIPYIPLKGAVLRPLYPEEWMRTSCDIDILVREEDVDRAAEALINTLGYKADENPHYHDVSLFSPEGVHLELHFSIKEAMENIDSLLSKVWEYASASENSLYRYELTPEFFLFHHIAHMSYHFTHGGCGIKPFIDLYIIEKNITFDDNVVRQYCKQCGIESFYNYVLQLTNVWFGNEKHSEITQKMQDYIISGGVYGSQKNQIALNQSKKGSNLKFILYRIFMPYNLLKTAYPVLEKHKWLYGFMLIHRWFKIFFGGRLKRAARELSISTSIDSKSITDMERLLRELGLHN